MLDTVGPELQMVNKTDHPISLQADTLVVLTPDQGKEATSNLLPINFNGLSKVSIYSFMIYSFLAPIKHISFVTFRSSNY